MSCLVSVSIQESQLFEFFLSFRFFQSWAFMTIQRKPHAILLIQRFCIFLSLSLSLSFSLYLSRPPSFLASCSLSTSPNFMHTKYVRNSNPENVKKPMPKPNPTHSKKKMGSAAYIVYSINLACFICLYVPPTPNKFIVLCLKNSILISMYFDCGGCL